MLFHASLLKDAGGLFFIVVKTGCCLYNNAVIRKKIKWAQVVRFLVQLGFLGAMAFAGFNTKIASDWLFPTILLAGVFFCGWVCPLGAVQDWMSRLGRLLKLPRLRVPQGVQRYLQLSRYVFYALLTMGITFSLLKGPYNFSKLVHGELLTLASGIIVLFLLLGLFIDRPFCNYFCTGGARQGLFSVLRIVGIRRRTEQCAGCGSCSKKCPMNIDVAGSEFVRHPNCIGCLSCVSACPKKCLSLSLMPGLKSPAGKR